MLRRPRDARDGKESDVAHSRASGGSPCTRPQAAVRPVRPTQCLLRAERELRFAAAVPRGSGVLRYAPNALFAAVTVCGLYPARRGKAGAEMLVGLVARRPRRAPAGSPHLM